MKDFNLTCSTNLYINNFNKMIRIVLIFGFEFIKNSYTYQENKRSCSK